MRRIFLLMMLFMVNAMMQAQMIRLPRFFSDGMVLQRNVKVPVWGKVQTDDEITVTINGKSVKTKADADGNWKVYLPKMKAGGPYVLTVKAGGASKQVSNVLIGDVFLCSGQSNMELPIRRCMDVVANEVRDYSNDNIRYLKFPHQFNYVRPNDDVTVLRWQNITPQNCAEVSGICYFMAKELQAKYGVPVGIINSAVGGTQVQAWMPRDVLATFEGYDKELQKAKYNQENWVDSVRRAETKAGMDWEKTMNAKDTVMLRWNEQGYDFSSWKTVDMFSNWSGRKNGSYWFRTTVDIPKELAGKKGILRFGAMKDADTIFVNGQYVGNTTYEYPPRVYQVNEGILREGRNDIVVHLMSQSGMGNFTKGKLYQLEIGELVFPLPSQIQMAVGCTMPPKPASTYFVDTPTGLYNAMIAPLRDFPVKGMLWYQGESNQGNSKTYAAMLKAMVEAWRGQFKSDFPVVIMQLPGYMSKHANPVETGWTQIRNQQYVAAHSIKGASLAPTLDTGEYNDIHPQDKKTAGKRAAQQMSRLAYGDKSKDGDVPMPVSAKVADGKIVLTFSGVADGLKQGELHDFAILAGGKYQWAEAKVAGKNIVNVALPEGVSTTTVRYCWDDYPQPSLFNSMDVPAPQFEIEAK